MILGNEMNGLGIGKCSLIKIYCVVMHVGRFNSQFDYMLGDKLLKTAVKENDLGVINCNA